MIWSIEALVFPCRTNIIVTQAHFVHKTMTHTFFGDAVTNITHDAKGMSFRSKTAAYLMQKAKVLDADTDLLSYSDIDSISNIWRWLEGPVRSATTGKSLVVALRFTSRCET